MSLCSSLGPGVDPEPRDCPGDASGRLRCGAGWGRDGMNRGAPRGTRTGAENRVRRDHGFQAAERESLRHDRGQAPGPAALGTRREATLSIPGHLCHDGGGTGTEGASGLSVGCRGLPEEVGVEQCRTAPREFSSGGEADTPDGGRSGRASREWPVWRAEQPKRRREGRKLQEGSGRVGWDREKLRRGEAAPVLGSEAQGLGLHLRGARNS